MGLSRPALLTGAFTLGSALLVWWAEIQMIDIRTTMGSTFEPPRLAWLLWSVTLVGAGLVLGLAVAAGAGWRTRLRPLLASWGLVPLTAIVLFHFWVGGWISSPPRAVLSQSVQTTASLAIGVFVSGLLAPRLPAVTGVENTPGSR